MRVRVQACVAVEGARRCHWRYGRKCAFDDRGLAEHKCESEALLASKVYFAYYTTLVFD
jgi:hypothetical protein